VGCTCVQSYNAPGNVQYSNAQIQSLWVQAGGNPQAAAIAAAIAIHESGGNTTATCVNGGSGCSCNGCVDRGLWQIDSVHGAQSTYDPMGNARAAVSISGNGTNWSAWGNDYNIVTSQGVPPYNPDNSAPINATNAAAGQGAITTALTWNPNTWLNPFNWFGGLFSGNDPIDAYIGKTIQGLVIAILNPVINAVAGIGGVLAGGTMVLFGVFVVVSNTRTGQEAERTAGRAVEAGVSLYGPETRAATQYVGQTGQVTTVSQQRRQAGAVRLGGRRIQYRPGRVQTTVTRPREAGPEQAQRLREAQRIRGTRQVINDEARSHVSGYQRRGPIHR
jgi:Lysozyme like domain